MQQVYGVVVRLYDRAYFLKFEPSVEYTWRRWTRIEREKSNRPRYLV